MWHPLITGAGRGPLTRGLRALSQYLCLVFSFLLGLSSWWPIVLAIDVFGPGLSARHDIPNQLRGLSLVGVGIYGSGDGSITKRTATQKRASNRKPFQVMLLTLNND